MSKESTANLLSKMLRQEKAGTTRSGRAPRPNPRYGEGDGEEGGGEDLPPRATAEEVAPSQRGGRGRRARV